MSTEYPDIIQCECGQRMRLPAESKSKYFRCVKCGAFVDRKGVRKKDTQKLRRSGLKMSSGRGVHRSGLLSIFVDGGLISPQQGEEAAAAAKENKEKTYRAIVRLGFATREQLHAFLARESGAAAISLSHFSIEQSVATLLPREMVLSQLLLPIDKLGRSLTVAMVCPMDKNAVKRAEEHTKLRIRPMLCTWDDFDAACKKLYPQQETGTSLFEENPAVKEEQEEDLQQDAPVEHAPIPPMEKKIEEEVTVEEATFERPLGLEQGEPLSDRIRLLSALHIPNRVMNRIDSILGVDTEGLKKISAIVSNSPPFAAKIISMANSKAHGMSGQVDNVPMAVTLLGAETIALVATGTLKQSSQWEQYWLPMRHFSRHVAKINATIAALTEMCAPVTAYSIGLLHGLGSYALAAIESDVYAKIDPRMSGVERAEAENTKLGMTHSEAGWHLAQAWGLPEEIIAPITHYLRPENAPDQPERAYSLQIAVALADRKGRLQLEKLEACTKALEHLNISAKDTAQALKKSPWLNAPAPAK